MTFHFFVEQIMTGKNVFFSPSFLGQQKNLVPKSFRRCLRANKNCVSQTQKTKDKKKDHDFMDLSQLDLHFAQPRGPRVVSGPAN